MFGRVIELTSAVSERMGGRQVETVVSGMPVDGTVLWPGGQVTNEYVLGVLETRTYTGQAASAALALNRMATAPEPALRRSSSDRSRNLDDRLRALGVRV